MKIFIKLNKISGLVLRRSLAFQSFDSQAKVAVSRRRLPHWRQHQASYFVTFRLADSVPQTLLHQWQGERAMWIRLHPLPWLTREQREYDKRFNRRVQEWLDAGMGACVLRRCDVRDELARCLLEFDTVRYHVDSYVIMPNHVHLVIAPQEQYELSIILRGIKGVSANRCNKLLGQKGRFWMDESYDHIIRDANELGALRDYIVENPKKAHLKRGEYSLEVRNTIACRPE